MIAAAREVTANEEAGTMKAVVFHAIGNISLENEPDPTLQHDQDAIVRLTASAICEDLHMVRGTFLA